MRATNHNIKESKMKKIYAIGTVSAECVGMGDYSTIIRLKRNTRTFYRTRESANKAVNELRNKAKEENKEYRETGCGEAKRYRVMSFNLVG